MRMRRVASWVAIGLVAAVLATGCGGDDDEATDAGSDREEATTASAPAEDADSADATEAPDEGDGEQPVDEGDGSGEGGAEACADDLEVTGASDADGPLEPGSFWSDGAPHPDNLEIYDRNMDIVLASYDIPEDPQFGLQIPVGEPEVPDGEVLLLASMSVSQDQPPIGAGTRFVDVFDDERAPDEGSFGNIRLYHGSEWLSDLVPLELTITDLADDRICATVAKLDASAQGPALEGSFTTERLEVIDA